MKLKLFNLFILLLVASLGACSKTDEQSELAKDSVVLAVVNGESITQNEVEFMLERTFSDSQQFALDKKLQSKILDSLIAAKAMKHEVTKQLTSEEIYKIQQKVNAYADELYIKQYLINNATPVPVSTKMVEEYYNSHLSEFGGGDSKTFEMLKTAAKPAEAQRDKILSSINQTKNNANWSQYAKDTKDEFGFTFFKSKLQPKLLEPQLERAVNALGQGETSGVVFIKGIPHIFKVIKVDSLTPKPLASVSSKIRKKLSAIQLKKAVKKASEDVLKNAVIELK